MNNNTPKSEILQGVICKEEIKKLSEKYGYEDTGRKLDVYTLCRYYMLSAMKGTKSQRELALQGKSNNLPRVDHSSISKKSKAVPYEIFLELCHNIIEKSNRAVRRKSTPKYRRIIKIIDSTRIIEQSGKWKWAPYKQGHCGIKLHISRLPQSGMVSEIFVSEINVSDSSKLVSFGDNDACLIADRGYMSISKMCKLDERGQEFVVRILNHTNILNAVSFDPGTPECYTDVLCTLGKDPKIAAKYRNHRFRVVSFEGNGGEMVTLCTNVQDLSAQEIADLYRQRWTIETFFKSFKQNFQIKNLFGTTTNAVFSQAIIAFLVSIIFSTLFAVAKINNFIPDKDKFINFIRKIKFNNLSFPLSNLILCTFC